MRSVDLELRHAVEPTRLGQLLDLYAATWWAADRNVGDVTRMLARSDHLFVLVDRVSDRLVAFARVLTDDVYLAVVLDVVVARDERERGLGRLLMRTMVDDPRLAKVQSLELVCQPELVDFYRKWGFTDDIGRSLLMRRTSRRQG